MSKPGAPSDLPPPYSGTAPPGYGHEQMPPGGQPMMYPQAGGVQVMGGPAIMVMAPFGPYPQNMTCPQCHSEIITATNAEPGLLTYLLCGGLALLGCWAGCCLIPFCVPECQDTDHHCPSCKAFLGRYRRL